MRIAASAAASAVSGYASQRYQVNDAAISTASSANHQSHQNHLVFNTSHSPCNRISHVLVAQLNLARTAHRNALLEQN